MSQPLLRTINANVNHASLTALRTTFALLFHTSQGGALARITAHPVEMERNRPRIGAGNLLTPNDEMRISQLLNGIRGGTQNRLLLPDGLLASTPEITAWFVPGAARAMHFAGENATFSIDVTWPSLVLAATRQGLFAAATATERRPQSETEPMFVAPVGNVGRDSRVCTGTATVPLTWDIQSIAGWNEVMFDTCFTHANNDAVVGITQNNTAKLHAFWKSRVGQGPFPAQKLVRLGTTLGSWLEGVCGNER